MKKQTKQLLVAIAALVVVVGVFAYLNRGNIAEKNQLQANAIFKIVKDGNTLCEVTMTDMQAIGLKQVSAVQDTSTTDPTNVTFTAVQVKDILAYKKIALDGVKTVEFDALDGFASALSLEDVQKDQNVFMCTQKNGKDLGTKSDGGMGPYLMIIKSDAFSQRWCKFVEKIVLK
jgi:hypothetical protein